MKLGGRPGAPGAVPPWWARLGSESHAAGLEFSGSLGAGPTPAPTPRWRVWGSPGLLFSWQCCPQEGSQKCALPSLLVLLRAQTSCCPAWGLGWSYPLPIISSRLQEKTAPCLGLLALVSSTLHRAEQGRSSFPRSPRQKLRGRGCPASLRLIRVGGVCLSSPGLEAAPCPSLSSDCEKSPDLCRPSLIFFSPQILFLCVFKYLFQCSESWLQHIVSFVIACKL